METIFHAPFIWIKSWNKRNILVISNQCGTVACAVILLKGGWTLRTVGLKKSSFITKDEHEACQLTRTKVPQKKPEKTGHRGVCCNPCNWDGRYWMPPRGPCWISLASAPACLTRNPKALTPHLELPISDFHACINAFQ